MRTSRVVIVVAIVAIAVLLAVFLYTSALGPSSGVWKSGPQYPLSVGGTGGVVGQSCVNSSSSIYCVGGIDYNGASRSNVYSASVSSTGMSGWSSQTAYPQTVGLESCVAQSGYVYCTGGSYDDAGDDIASSYYAPVTGSGIGAWNSTTPYPVPIDSQSCAAASGYIYCVGGENETDGTNSTVVASNSAWYAPLLSSGIGSWKHTTAYPAAVSYETCAASATDIYCVGGTDSSGNGVGDVYYAPLSPSGIGQWSPTTAYPAQLYGQVCTISAGSIICVGGVPNGTTSASDAVYSASVSSGGVRTWHKAPNYPFGIETACLTVAGNVYCSGGYQDSSAIASSTYYAAAQSLLA